MALIKCSECGKEISDKAHHCPHCGNFYRKRTLQTKKEKSLAFKILIPIISSKDKSSFCVLYFYYHGLGFQVFLTPMLHNHI